MSPTMPGCIFYRGIFEKINMAPTMSGCIFYRGLGKKVYRYFRENVEKTEFSMLSCVDSRKRVHFRNFCHDSMIEDCSKIRNKA